MCPNMMQIYIVLNCLLVKCLDMMQIYIYLFFRDLLVKCHIIVMQIYLKCLKV